MENKRQHFVPKSYLKAWCDPTTPAGQNPYVWVHSDDGVTKKNKDPDNIFWETDYYTIQQPDGSRDLTLEKFLGSIETHFPRILKVILSQRGLGSAEDWDVLFLYAALMLNRTRKQRTNILDAEREIHEMVVSLEKSHNAPPTLSLQTKVLAEQGHHIAMMDGLLQILNFLRRMSKALIFSCENEYFITSDSPCFLHNPKAGSFPPMLRSPGFAQKDVECILPLSPDVAFIATWSDLKGVHVASKQNVDFVNRLIRFKCHEFFVTRNGVINDFWFDPGKEPDDSWDKLNK
jgi:hypothetical protein